MRVGKPVLLDLFCGAGGATKGYQNAGFHVIGEDLAPQPRYCGDAFNQRDAMKRLEWLAHHPKGVWGYDVIHASPPCQRYSDLAKRNGNAEDWPDFVESVRFFLQKIGLPYIIENVEGSPLHGITLCGTMFPGLRVIRHRVFESNMPLVVPPHGKHPLVFTHDKRKAHYGKLNQHENFVQVTGGGNCSVQAARSAMGISWMSKAEINEAIPPAYTEYIGLQILRLI